MGLSKNHQEMIFKNKKEIISRYKKGEHLNKIAASFITKAHTIKKYIDKWNKEK